MSNPGRHAGAAESRHPCVTTRPAASAANLLPEGVPILDLHGHPIRETDMNNKQQAAWDVVYTASHCAPGTGMVLTREQALELIDMMGKRMDAKQESAWSVVVRASKARNCDDSAFLTRDDARALLETRGGVTMPEEPTPEALRVMFKQFLDGEGNDLWGRVYRALRDHLARPKTRTEWWITGYAANGELIYSGTACTEAERDSFYRSALGTAGVKRVTIEACEVEG